MPVRMTCPGCQTPVAMPSHLAGKRARCPRCQAVFSTNDLPRDASATEAITARPGSPPGPRLQKTDVPSLEPAEEWPDVRLQMRCDSCGKTLDFPATTVGTVQECPDCGGYIDVPEIGRPPTTAEVEEAIAARTARERELQSQETTRQQAATAEQIEQAQRALDRRDQQDDRYDKLLDRFEAVIVRWEQLVEQAGRLIEQMGRQDTA
jgi:predicted  nucleic acid-binding Zn-ribbon protein